MADTLPIQATPEMPVRKSIRRLRWFMRAFAEQVARTSVETGNQFQTDPTKLSAVFVDWLRAFEAQKPANVQDRLPYVGFAAGLMLKTLVSIKPVEVLSKPDAADESNPAYLWPEGYLYVAFCLNVRGMVLEQDFHETQAVVPELSEARTWWSFKENVAEDPALAIAFLDLFAGETPQWTMPDVFRGGQAAEIAARFYEAIPSEPG